MSAQIVTGWRNRPPAPSSVGSVFVADPVFNGHNTNIAARTAATKALQPVILPGSINCETKGDVWAKRWRLARAGI